ncbi:O-antigen ligase family protein [Gallibacter sp. Marseille-QA0791]|uniref:O-antigen ligase family protein n=1 Tax=Gallibacter sp. Marseille-QA0791 TaxID=3378781 RepID=UPI003D0FF7A3
MDSVNRLNVLVGKILMPIMAILFICTNTVLNLWIDERIETIQNLLVIVVLFIVAVNLLSSPRNNLIPWLKNNVLVVAYFIIRLISLWQCGFDYSVIRTIFFEMFFLIGICGYTINAANKRNFYIKFFILFELIISILCIILFFIIPHLSAGMQELVAACTYYEKAATASLFSNVNTAGIMAGFSIVLAVAIYKKNILSGKFVIAFGCYNVIALIFFGARSADIGIIVVLLFIGIKYISKSGNLKRFTIIALCLMVLTLIPIYGMVGYYESKQTLSYESIEDKLSSLSSSRYIIWKESFLIQQDNLLFGKGNLKLEQEARKELIDKVKPMESTRFYAATELGPHNGYIGMISGTGWLGFLVFIAILIQRIRRSKSLESGNWYLLLIFFFAINCFESLFILNRFFICFYMFLILESDWEKGDETYLDNIKTDK